MSKWWTMALFFGCTTQADTDTLATTTTTTPPTPTTTAPNPEEEICDGIDNDLDGEIDEGVMTTWYLDADGDGYGVPDTTVEACERPPGYSGVDNDCDDTDDQRFYEGATDTCDGVDNDCDGVVDEDHRADWVLATIHSDNTIREIDVATGQTSIRVVISGLSLSTNVNSADSLDANNLMLQTSDFITHELVALDACTGVATHLGPHGEGNLPGIAFGLNGVLYAVDATADTIVELDPQSMTGEAILDLGFNLGASGLAYDCSKELIWVADGAGRQIFWYDAATNTTGGFVLTSVPFQSVGLEFDTTTMTLLASTGDEIWRIDPLTGDATYESTLDVGDVNDLVLLPPCAP